MGPVHWRPIVALNRGVRPKIMPGISLGSRHFHFSARALVTGDSPVDEIAAKDKSLGEKEDTESTGVIEKTNQETLMYFANLLLFDFLQYPRLKSLQDYLNRIASRSDLVKNDVLKLASPKDNPIPGISINLIIPKDGGAFVKFQIPYDQLIAETNIAIQENTAKGPSPFFGLFPKPQCFPVKGTPWVEDLRRYPSSQLKVVFEGEDLTEEKLYQVFRRYGKILDIIPQPPDSKEVPRYAVVKFWRTRSAIAAKNCVNALQIDNTTLHIKYQRIVRESFVKDLLFKHMRISVPILLALLLALGLIIFEPIREFFMQEKIEKRFSLEQYKSNSLYQSVLTVASSIKHFFSRPLATRYFQPLPMWSDRLDKIKEIKLWLTENVGTFIVVQGQKGAGKEELVLSYALEDRKNVLVVDCEELVKSRNDSEFLRHVAKQFGYFPIFPWLNLLSTFIDLGVQGLTGQKSGLSESCDVQFKNILSLSIMAVKKVSLRFYKAYVKAQGESSSQKDRVSEEDYLQQHPDEKPVIVINKFAAKLENYLFIYTAIANWALFLVTMNLAHVVFLVDDISPLPVLTEALPDQVFKMLVLSDASKSSSTEYVLGHLNAEDALEVVKKEEGEQEIEKVTRRYAYSDIEKALEPIGGRMLDLQSFVRRVKSGESPEEAQKEMITQTAEQIVQMNLIKNTPADDLEVARSWEIIKLLAKNESVPFTKIYMTPLFKSNPVEYLLNLEKTGLVSLVKEKGLIKEVKASRALYRSAFQNIVSDKRLYSVLETDYLVRRIAYETKVIKGCEEEISKLSYVAQLEAVKARFEYLGNKITTCTENVKNYESLIKELVSGLNEKKRGWF